MSSVSKASPRRKSPVVVAQITTRDFLNTFFYYRWTAAAVVSLILLMGVAVAFLLPPTYQADARLLTLFAGYYDMQSDHAGSQASANFDPTQVSNIESQILASPELHRAVVMEDMGPNPDPLEVDRRLRRFESHFKIEKVEASNVLELSFVDTSPTRAAHVLDRLIQAYFRQRAGVFTSGQVAFLVTQRDTVKAQLNRANAQLIAFQKLHGVVNIDAQITSAVALNGLLLQRKLENDTALAQDRGTLGSLAKESKTVPATIELYGDNTEIAHAADTMQMSLLQLEARRADLASRYLDGSPFVQQIDQQITDVKASIARRLPQLLSATRIGHNAYYDTVQDRLVRLISDVAGEASRQIVLADQVQDSLTSIQDLIQVANQLRRMEIDRDLLVDSFKNFSRQVEQAQIAQNQADTISSTNVRIIQAPFPPAHRSNPPALFIAASLLAGILLSGISIVIMSSLRETFLSPEEAERSLGLPVLSAPLSAEKQTTPLTRLNGQLSRSAAVGAQKPATPASAPALPPRRPRTEFGRMISAINNSSENATKVVMMLAFRADDGVASVSLGLAEELERRSTRPVLILDLTPGEGQSYGALEANGLVQWAGGPGQAPSWGDAASGPKSAPDADALFTFHPVDRHHIVIGRPRPSALLPVGRQGTGLFDAFRQTHDYIIVHAPPAAGSFVGIETAILADATVLAIRAEATRKPIALSLKNQLLDAGGTIIGIALTNRRSYIPAFVYRFL
jgi:uncharacterized protein involved in exopolysaccharide biosynthesis/Mrp family chromosome partitioning ATPase